VIVGFLHFSWLVQEMQNKKKTKLQLHSQSEHHLTSMVKWECYINSKKLGTVSVISQLSAASKEQIFKNQEYIRCLCDIVLYHGRQGIALRAHREDENSLNKGIESLSSWFSFY